MEQTDIVIIGAGVIGLAIAAELSSTGKNIIVLEKEDSFGQHTSSRNSEVIHAGIYYKPNSLKAKLCVEGRDLLYELCVKENIPCQKIGKLVIACDDQEIQKLYQLQQNAQASGVKLDFLTQEQVKTLEPNIKVQAALFSSQTGIIDSHCLMAYLNKKAADNNVDIVFDAKVNAIEHKNNVYIVSIDNQGENILLKTGVIINCAGNNADDISSLLDIEIKQHYLKGNYFRIADKYRSMTKHLVYPVPTPKSLGLHTVVSLDGGIKLGPDEEDIDVFDYKVDPKRSELFFNEASKYLPFLKQEDLVPDMSGIRPRLVQRDKDGFADFVIREESDNKKPGFINLVGIDSPGLTASLAIAKHVKTII